MSKRKWTNVSMFSAEIEQLRHDINLRDMQFIWGVFSAIPASILDRCDAEIRNLP